MTIDNMHHLWQHPHMFHNTRHKHNGERRGRGWGGKPQSNNDPLTSVRGWRAKSSRRSFTQTVWNIPHRTSEPARRPVNLLRGSTHGITQTSIWPTSGRWSILCFTVVYQTWRGVNPCEGMRGKKTKLNNCRRGEHELPPFRAPGQGGNLPQIKNTEHFNLICHA